MEQHISRRSLMKLAGAAASLTALCACSTTGAGAKKAAEADASGFVLLADAVPDAIQEIRYYSTYNFVGERIDGYEQPCALLTKEAAAALKAASDDAVRRGYRLKIYDAYRPQRAVGKKEEGRLNTSRDFLSLRENKTTPIQTSRLCDSVSLRDVETKRAAQR